MPRRTPTPIERLYCLVRDRFHEQGSPEVATAIEDAYTVLTGGRALPRQKPPQSPRVRAPKPAPSKPPAASGSPNDLWAAVTLQRHSKAGIPIIDIMTRPELCEKAYRLAAKATHPDKHRGDGRLFAEVNAAVEILRAYWRRNPHGSSV